MKGDGKREQLEDEVDREVATADVRDLVAEERVGGAGTELIRERCGKNDDRLDRADRDRGGRGGREDRNVANAELRDRAAGGGGVLHDAPSARPLSKQERSANADDRKVGEGDPISFLVAQ